MSELNKRLDQIEKNGTFRYLFEVDKNEQRPAAGRKAGDPIPKRLKYPPGTIEKPCTGCKQVKPLAAFNPLKNGALGRSSKCRDCLNAIGKEYTRKKREAKADGRPRPDHCEVCGMRSSARRSLHWDHDHVTGRFRGWLCSGCNCSIGNARESPSLLRKLADDLERRGTHDTELA